MVTVNASDFIRETDQLKLALANTEQWLRPLAIELSGMMSFRIHSEGKATDGSLIGNYAKTYLQIRKQHKLGASEKVILVLTRKLSNSWNVFASTNNGWAVGFPDSGGAKGSASSLEKLKYAEAHFGKKIIVPTEEENIFIAARLQELINPLFLQHG